MTPAHLLVVEACWSRLYAKQVFESNFKWSTTALGGAFLGPGGYYRTSKRCQHETLPAKPIHGTPGDFVRVIDELKASLAGAAVTARDWRAFSSLSAFFSFLFFSSRARPAVLRAPTFRGGVPDFDRRCREQLKIVSAAQKYRMLIVPYCNSGGTSIEGHFTGVRTCPSVIRRVCDDHVFSLRFYIVGGGRGLRRHVGNGQDH
ncbi:hypothetical protein EDB85DRAFT_1267314 [Lactarius pseudohatsudake]|nr:hypothetical protein EDB85DRAFT_1267314 [Lactarius pseudohatsudake]